MGRIIDADTHFLEPPTVYANPIGAARPKRDPVAALPARAFLPGEGVRGEGTV